MQLPLLIKGVNQVTRGWCGYFHYGHSTKALSRVKWFAEERLRKHLCKRHKVRTRTEAYRRFTTRYLYCDLGLFKIPTSAKWKKVHAL